MKKIIYMEITTYLVGQVAMVVKSVVGKFRTIIQRKKIKKLNNDLMALLFGRVFFYYIKDGDYYGFANNFSN